MKKLSKSTIEKLLNEIFSLHRSMNEVVIGKFAEGKNIERFNWSAAAQQQSSFIENCWLWAGVKSMS